jgi:hypothetical protein
VGAAASARRRRQSTSAPPAARPSESTHKPSLPYCVVISARAKRRAWCFSRRVSGLSRLGEIGVDSGQGYGISAISSSRIMDWSSAFWGKRSKGWLGFMEQSDWTFLD